MNKKMCLENKLRQRGFTLTEMVVVLAMLAVVVSIFYTVFLSNWSALDNFTTRAVMHKELDEAIDIITQDGLESSGMTVASDNKSVTFSYDAQTNRPDAVYLLASDGTLSISRDGNPSYIASNNIDYSNSGFVLDGRSLAVRIGMVDNIFDRQVNVSTSTQIFPRNNFGAGSSG